MTPDVERPDLEHLRDLLDGATVKDVLFARAVVYALALEAQLQRGEEALRRAVYIAEHLFQMVPKEVWRDEGGDDMQGHYEGDSHAEQVRDEIASFRAALPDSEPKEPRPYPHEETEA